MPAHERPCEAADGSVGVSMKTAIANRVTGIQVGCLYKFVHPTVVINDHGLEILRAHKNPQQDWTYVEDPRVPLHSGDVVMVIGFGRVETVDERHPAMNRFVVFLLGEGTALLGDKVFERWFKKVRGK